jgi:Transglycosylase SLT domain
MLVDPSTSTAGLTVTGAIRQAAQATGTSFQYLLATAQVESGLDPKAGAPTSSARGLFQFVEQTWLGTLKQSGAALGYGQYAAAITKTASGHYQVQDPAMRSAILKLRNDPIANAVMAGAFTQANAALLSAKLGRAPSEGELYIAHFLGAGGAARLISAAASNPNAAAASHFPDAAQANSSIFYDRTTGAARSLARVRDILTARYDVAARGSNETANVAQVLGPPRGIVTIPRFATASVPGGVAAVPAAAAAPTLSAVTPAAAPVAMAPDTAGMTSAFADAAPKRVQQENDIFHGLFADPGRASPVAEVVSQLWGVSGATSPDAGGALLDLFKDDGKSA